jgi:hypothetical protein
MRTYLVVAHRTLVGPALVEHVRTLGSPGEVRLHLVVPVRHPTDHAWSDGEVEAVARARLEEGLAAFRGLGFEVTGEVGDANPVYAVTTALRGTSLPFDGIIVSTLHSSVSRWLHLDVVSRLRREVELPITHVEAREDAAPGPTQRSTGTPTSEPYSVQDPS